MSCAAGKLTCARCLHFQGYEVSKGRQECVNGEGRCTRLCIPIVDGSGERHKVPIIMGAEEPACPFFEEDGCFEA